MLHEVLIHLSGFESDMFSNGKVRMSLPSESESISINKLEILSSCFKSLSLRSSSDPFVSCFNDSIHSYLDSYLARIIQLEEDVLSEKDVSIHNLTYHLHEYFTTFPFLVQLSNKVDDLENKILILDLLDQSRHTGIPILKVLMNEIFSNVGIVFTRMCWAFCFYGKLWPGFFIGLIN